MNLRKKSTREEFERALAQCKPEDFDGHSEFHRLTPEQRLEWLCQAAAFVYEFKGKARHPGADASDSASGTTRRQGGLAQKLPPGCW